MPHLNGRQLVMELRTHHQTLPVLFISGYTADVLGEISPQNPHEQLLKKPFSIEDLLQKIKELC